MEKSSEVKSSKADAKSSKSEKKQAKSASSAEAKKERVVQKETGRSIADAVRSLGF